MGSSVVVVLLMLLAGVLVGRSTGRSLTVQYLSAFLAVCAVSTGFFLWVMLGH